MENIKYVRVSPAPRQWPANPSSRNAANYVAETVQGTGSEASKEVNKRMFLIS